MPTHLEGSVRGQRLWVRKVHDLNSNDIYEYRINVLYVHLSECPKVQPCRVQYFEANNMLFTVKLNLVEE